MNKSILLSKRISVAALALSLGITILIVVAFLITSSQGLLEMERSIADEASERAEAVLNSKIEDLTALTEDYALWDDMLFYLQGRDPSFISRTFSDSSLENLGLHFVALYGVQGKLLWSWTAGGTPSLHLPRILEGSSAPFSPIQETIQGIYRDKDRLFLISSMGANRSDGSLKSQGRLVFGKEINHQLESEISKLTLSQVSLLPLRAEGPKPIPLERSALHQDLYRRSILPDITGQSALVLQVTLKRGLFQEGHRLIEVFLLLFILVMGIAVLIFFLAFRIFISHPLRQLERIILLQESDTEISYLELKKFQHRRDIIGTLARMFERSNRVLRKNLQNERTAAQRLETEVTQRTQELLLNIDKLKNAEEALHTLAFFDPLTKLPNRSLFMDRISHALGRAQRSQNRLALLYLDLDHFKNVNDAYGHQVGDQLLIETAQRLLRQVRDVDTVCRLGGDEFTIILESITRSSDASLVAKKIVNSLKPAFYIYDREIYAPASVGIALYPYDGKTVDELLKNADAAMYEAKEAGRGQFHFASGAAGKSSKQRLEMEALLRRALEKEKFVINFQPQVSTGSAIFGSNRGLVGAEALIRMGDQNERILPPDSFIEIAEDTGLIVPMGEWMLFQACAEAKRWADAGRPIPVAVNVSQRQFEKGVVVQQTAAALAASGLKPELLKLEITESLFMRDLQGSVKVMEALKEMGVSFAMDDFGTGYSSLRYLDSLPIDILKIDKSFIDRISSNQEDGAVALAVVSLARSFGLVSIAEGVETQEQLDALKVRGCDTIQGYYISKPLDSQEFYEFLTDTAMKVPMQELRFSGEDSQLEELETVL